jgi:hypothetical protein
MYPWPVDAMSPWRECNPYRTPHLLITSALSQQYRQQMLQERGTAPYHDPDQKMLKSALCSPRPFGSPLYHPIELFGLLTRQFKIKHSAV